MTGSPRGWPTTQDSVSVTTPHGTDVMSISSIDRPPQRSDLRPMRSQLTSVEPPPMSISSAWGMSGSIRFSQLATASRASSGRRNDLEAQAGARLDQGEEVLAVAGAAAGLGGDVAGARDAIALDLGGADIQRLERAVDRVAAQRPAQRHPLAQPDRPGIGVDDVEALDRRARDQEPAVVGAEVDGSERVGEPATVPAPLCPLL